MAEDKVFDLNNIPEDAEVFTSQSKNFEPIDPSEMYQVEVLKVQLKENPFYKPDEKDPDKMQVKYNFSFEYVIIDEESEFYGRRIWDTTSLAFKPETKRGATKLYKIINMALKRKMTWDECAEYAPDTRTLYEHLLNDVIGKQLRVAIENKENPDTKKTRTKIASYSEAKKDLPAFDIKKADSIAKAKKQNPSTDEDDPSGDIPF